VARKVLISKTAVTALAAGAATLTFSNIPSRFREFSLGVEYYNAATGQEADSVVPTAGTETTTYKSHVKRYSEQSAGAAVNSADEGQISWSVPTRWAQCVLAAVAGNGVTHVRGILIGHVS